jgi:cytochrome c554/c'-like protein
VLLLPLLALWMAAASASDYAGAEACRNCHPGQFAAQSATAHTRSLARSKPSQPGDWAFGAGMQAITFVTRLNSEYYREEAQTWYRRLGGIGRTPGHTSANGIRERIFDPAATILRCFACHSTGPLEVTEERGIVPNELGVRCETCHGPAAAHVGDPARVKPQNPARLTADAMNRLCGECHRMPAKELNEPGLRDPWNARHQPFMLAASNCFMRSNGRLNCTTCHPAHRPVATEPAAYSQACRQCHAAPKHKVAAGARACVECHMPSVRPQPYLEFANHRIAVYGADPMLPVKGTR